MFFIYEPEGDEAQEWWFDPNKIRAQEAEAIERRCGWDWTQFGMHLLSGSALARRALLWTYLRRTHHVLRFEDVDFAMSEVRLEYSKEELAKVREEAEKQPAANDSDKAVMLAQLELQIAEAREYQGKAHASNDG
jgi:hypothetical protein